MRAILASIALASAGMCQQPRVQAGTPAATANQTVDSARAKFRETLSLEAEFASRNAAAQKQGFEAGRIDMARLTKAQQARIEADLKLAAFDAGVTSPPFPGASNRDEALRRGRSLLEEGVALTKTQVDFVSLQWRLGAATELDVYESRILHAKAVSRLAAWDSGLLDFAVQAANWQPQPRASEQWPRPQLDIRKDILRTEDELRKLVDKPSDTATLYAQRRLQYELKVLQLEMDAASK